MSDAVLLDVVAPQDVLDATIPEVNPFLTMAATVRGDGRFRVMTSQWGEGIHPRTAAGLNYLTQLFSLTQSMPAEGTRIIMQMADIPADVSGCGFQSQKGWRDLRLIPDIYYFEEGGFASFSPPPVPWSARRPAAVWRGSTSGLLHLTPRNLVDLPRYRLCRMALSLGAAADCKLIGIAQAATPADHQLIEQIAGLHGVMGSYLPMASMSAYKYLVDIDGNANAWNIVARLKLGCCLLKVASPWQQWIYDRLQPWEHYIPIKEDLSDFGAMVAWCLDHDHEAEQVAARGRNLACSLTFDGEMKAAAATMFDLDRP